jgi:soluble lytic murein transglycosylase-like protein
VSTTTVPTTTALTTTVTPTTDPAVGPRTTVAHTTHAPVTTRRPTVADTMPPPTKAAHPPNVALPPLPHQVQSSAPTTCKATFSGTAAPHDQVASTLTATAGTQYWVGVSTPPLEAVDGTDSTVTGPPAQITLPPTLVEAVAWQESGWSSSIVSCDGGHGVMQVQSATADWMNQRFGTSYDYTTLSGNAAIGGEYLEWLVAYFGENNFGHHYDTSDPDLITAILDAYNAGPGSVTFSGGHTVESHYAATVEALMTQQPWNG